MISVDRHWLREERVCDKCNKEIWGNQFCVVIYAYKTEPGTNAVETVGIPAKPATLHEDCAREFGVDVITEAARLNK